jgi:hypothetical protein
VEVIGDLSAVGMSLAAMKDSHFQQGGEHPPHGPRWKRMHHSPFFWVAVVCISAAMMIYVWTNDLAFWPNHAAQAPVPAVSP